MRRLLKMCLALIAVALVLAVTLPFSVSAASDLVSIPYNVFTEDATGDESPETLPDPVIMDFTNESLWQTGGTSLDPLKPACAFFVRTSDTVQGLYEFTAYDDGSGSTTCLKLNYHELAGWYPYRVMPKFRSANKVTMDHKYIRITYATTDFAPATISLYNNAKGGSVTIVQNTGNSQGKWTRSNAVKIEAAELIDRFVNGNHCTVQYHSGLLDSEIYIKEIGFFATEKQAYDYYEDSEDPSEVYYTRMTFDPSGTGTTTDGETYGNHSVNAETGDLDIVYAAETNISSSKYLAKVKFKGEAETNATHRFMRVLYAAENPEGLSGRTSMFLRNDAKGAECILVDSEIEDTNGEYVLSDTVYLPDGMVSRITGTGEFVSPTHCSLMTNANLEGGTYSIKAIYFFPSRATADNFTYTGNSTTLTLNGNDISEYQIVVGEDAPIKVMESAKALASRVEILTGVALPIVTDSAPETDHEILVGVSNRELSYTVNETAQSHKSSFMFMDGDTFVVTSPNPPSTKAAMDAFVDYYLCAKLLNVPEKINIPENFYLNNAYADLNAYEWETVENADDPDRFLDRFGFDNGFWVEENAADDWYFEDGTYNSYKNGKTLSYIHTFERNVEYNMDMMYTDTDGDGDFGLMLRYNSAEAYVKAGYDFELGEWYITSRDGADFYTVKHASAAAELQPDTWYSLTFTVDGTDAVLYVDGKKMLSADDLTHVTPGRIAVYADSVSIRVDNADIYMLSGEGTVIPGVAHTKLDTPKYTEGGTVHELNDGTLVYHHQNGYGFYSYDNGVSWVEGEPCFPTQYSYMNVLRLLPTEGQEFGDFMQIISDGGKKYSATSSDEGKTWVRGENPICHGKYQIDGVDTTAGAGNMNDKLFQSARTGRIFYGQNYESKAGEVNGRTVFCEFYYSDDHGNTWTKSETDSWEIEGNEDQAKFGECKILECADGTLRMYNSWNFHECIVYSESYDNGVTWGPLQFMEDFPCAVSSMQFVRDPYAENDTTYYMVWVNCEPSESLNKSLPRSRLTLAKSTDGKNWEVLGDVWRWESTYKIGNALIQQVVDPFVQVTKDYVIVGSGLSECIGLDIDGGASSWHQSQRQHIYSIKKTSLGAELPALTFPYDADSDGASTLADLMAFNRYLAKWSDYSSESYDFSDFDISGDGKITPLDAVLFARHFANWDKYKDLSLVRYVPSTAKDRYIMTGSSVPLSAEGTPSDVGLYAFYGEDAYFYRYDKGAIELEGGTKVIVYSPVKLEQNRVYRVDENNVVYAVDELIGELPATGHSGTRHWLNALVNSAAIIDRNYAKYGITDINSSGTVRYNDWLWYQSRLYGTSATEATIAEANAKLLEYAKALTAVINNAIDGGVSADKADYSSLAANSDRKNPNCIKEFVRPYIAAGVKLAEDGSDIKFEPIPENVYDFDMYSHNTTAEFTADGKLTLKMNNKYMVTEGDNVTELVVVNQGNLAVWKYSEEPELTLKVLHSAPQSAMVGKSGTNDGFSKFLSKSLKDGVAVVMVGTINSDR